MKIRKAAFPFVALLVFVGCDDNNNASVQEKKPTTYSRGDLLPTGFESRAGLAVALADMDGDGDLDLVSAVPEGVKYFESASGDTFIDHGVIAETGFEVRAGVAIAIGDINGDAILDIVIAVPEGIQIIQNPIPQKK